MRKSRSEARDSLDEFSEDALNAEALRNVLWYSAFGLYSVSFIGVACVGIVVQAPFVLVGVSLYRAGHALVSILTRHARWWRPPPLPGVEACSVCFENTGGPASWWLTHCGHAFHARCLRKWVDTGKHTCPLCRAPIEAPGHACVRR